MRNKKLLDAMSLADEKFVAEAAPKYKSSRTLQKRIVLIAAIVTSLILSVGLWLFVPYSYVPENLRPYVDSEYFGVISALNSYNSNTPAVFLNNFDRYKFYYTQAEDLQGNIAVEDGVKEEADDMVAELPTSPAPDGAPNAGSVTESTADNVNKPSYEETTDNQVEGVIESDLFKRSDKHIFYLHGDTLKVYSIEKESSRLVSSLDINAFEGDYGISFEMFLSKDAKTLTVIASGYEREQRQTVVSLISFDVSEPEREISQKAKISVCGSYLSARLVDGDILLMTKFGAKQSTSFAKESDYIPQIDCGEGFSSVPAESIIYPEELTSSVYTVICRIDEDGLTLKDSVSLLSYSQEVYVSADNIYAARSFSKPEGRLGYTLFTAMTEITRISYSDGSFKNCGSVTLEGYIKDQYSLDEYEGILRAVTTTEKTVTYKKYAENLAINEELATSASLYCIGISDMKVRSSVIGFAPRGETVRSSRFDGDTAYICTAVQLTDPVFFFDLSDINNITYKETGNIEGYSSSLIELGGGYLLGIGYGSFSSTLKIEIYEESDSGVVSVCKYELPHTYFSQEYKSYYINRDENLVGLGITELYEEKESRYILLLFNGDELCEILNLALSGENHAKRAVLIDGYFYMLGGDDFKVEKLF